MKVTSALLSLAIASSVVSAHQNLLQSRHHPHDAVARRAAALNERGNPNSDGWVRKRQLLPVGDDDDEDVTTSARQVSTALPSTTVARSTPSSAATPTSTSIRTSAAVPTVTTPTTSAAQPTNTAPISSAQTPITQTSVTVVTSDVVSSASGTGTAVTSGTGTSMSASSTVTSAAVSSASSMTASATSTNMSLASTILSTMSTISSVITTSLPPLSTVVAEEAGTVTSRVSTDAQGSVIYVTEVQTLSRSSAPEDQISTIQETVSATGASSTSSAKKDESSHGLSTGAIVGISVVAGIIVLGLVLFLVWKLKQKRFASFDDDDADGIKWPELNRHGESDMHLPLPAKPTGGHGFETNAFERGRTDLDGNPIDDDYDAYSQNPVSHAASMHDVSPYYHDPSPPLPGHSMSYADTGVYGAGGPGVTRNPSFGASTYLSGGSDEGAMGGSLGGSRAFHSQPDPEMVEMTEARNGGLGRSSSGRLL